MNPKILMMMTGSVAAYKACGILSALKQKNYEIEVILSPSCLKFIGAATVEGLIGKSPIIDMYEPGHVMDHIHLQRWADLILVAPATAHFINRLAVGIGDDLASTLFLAHDFQKPFLLAPAMNTKMYMHPSTQKSLSDLKKMGVEVLESASGVLACGETGWGRLLEPKDIVEEIDRRLVLRPTAKHLVAKTTAKNLTHKLRKKVLITAGGTTEPIDAVRTLANISTGQTGYLIAKTLDQLGYDVHLMMSSSHAVRELHQQTSGFQIQFFSTFQSLSDLLKTELAHNHLDVVIHAAAVSDFRVETQSVKQKLDSSQNITLKLKKNPKLIQHIKKWSRNKTLQLIGFKLTASATEKEIVKKVSGLFETAQVDYVIHNDIASFQRDPSKHAFRFYSPDLQFQNIHDKETLLMILSQRIGEIKKYKGAKK